MRHIPNILSCFRIALIPFLVRHLLQGETLYAAILIGVSGATDLFDGMLARKFGWVSQLGKVLDPIADKLTQIAVCIVLAYRLRQYWYFFAILLLKEFLMLVICGVLIKKGVRLEGAKIFGKVATTLFYVCMTAIVLFPGMPPELTIMLLALVVISSLVAAFLYLPEYNRYKNSFDVIGKQGGKVNPHEAD